MTALARRPRAATKEFVDELLLGALEEQRLHEQQHTVSYDKSARRRRVEALLLRKLHHAGRRLPDGYKLEVP